ncbi:hypothetical protein K474DRAFT_1644863 [Panus rudis PR-1116 ss-1]|nr:hypothetical protein K474DRAFT_1644863 [Panus rudis PR-1116 ss-1]
MLCARLLRNCIISRRSPFQAPLRQYRDRGGFGSPAMWSTDVCATLSSDTEPSFVVTFDSAKYIINASENTARAWRQGGRHWRGVKALFMTGVGTQRSSGLPGLTMVLADASLKQLDLVGPHGLNHYIATMRFYLWRDGTAVKITEVASPLDASYAAAPTPVFQDDNITVYGIPLYPRTKGTGDDKGSKKRKRTPSPSSSSKRSQKASDAEREASPVPLVVANSVHGAPIDVNLADKLREPDFRPSTLTGSEAEEWRRVTVENMFPHQTPAKGPKGKKPQSGEQEGFSYGFGRHKIKDLRGARLPKFVPQISNSADPAKRQSLCYVIVGPKWRGKFDAAKAEELGLKGRDRARVASGQVVSFEVDDGKGGKITRTVKYEDVVGPSIPPRVIMVFDIPSPDHLEDLTRAFCDSPLYSRLRSKKKEDTEEHVVSVIYHICGPGVATHPDYISFLQGFPGSVNHVVAAPEISPDPVTFTSVGTVQMKLHHLDHEMFPLPHFNLTAPQSISDTPLAEVPNVHLMQSNMHFSIRPEKPFEIVENIKDTFHPVWRKEQPLTISPPTMASIRRSRSRSRSISPPPMSKNGRPKSRASSPVIPVDESEKKVNKNEEWKKVAVVPLGTSSASPTKYRNMSATLIQIPKWGNILLDAGEGTWGQLTRMFGLSNSYQNQDQNQKQKQSGETHTGGVWDVLRNMKCLYASHIHGDHHIGIAKILSKRKQMNPPPTSPLYLVGIHPVLLYLHEQSEVEDLGFNDPSGNGVIPILSDALNYRRAWNYGRRITEDDGPWMNHAISKAKAKEMCNALGLQDFLTVDVDHRTRCYGTVIKHQDKWSIVYSADTQPTKTLVEAGKGATLLIHEATMSDEQVEEARVKAHSTFGQAVSIGKQMEAQNILLTHFSARYPKLPPQSALHDTSWAIAMDHAKIPLGDITKLRVYMPAIRRVLDEVLDGDEEEEGGTTTGWD